MNIFLIIVWIISSISLWIFATSTTVENEKYKYLEFRIKSIFYWLAIIISLVIGILIK